MQILTDLLKLYFQTDNPDDIIASIEREHQNFLTKYKFNGLPTPRVSDVLPWYHTTSKEYDNQPFVLLTNNIYQFIDILYRKNILLDVLPYYINTYAHQEKDTFIVINKLFFYLHIDKEADHFPLIHRLLQKIDSDLVASPEWETVYHSHEFTQPIIFKTPVDFVKKYKIFSQFKDRIHFGSHLTDIQTTKNKELLFEIVQQNPLLFSYSFSQFLHNKHLKTTYKTQPTNDIPDDFIEEEFSRIYPLLTPEVRESIKGSSLEATFNQFNWQQVQEKIENFYANLDIIVLHNDFKLKTEKTFASIEKKSKI